MRGINEYNVAGAVVGSIIAATISVHVFDVPALEGIGFGIFGAAFTLGLQYLSGKKGET